ncbi:hypothetical protein LTS08_006200 [Lithohypha guttulata]|uniref:uncharacterized protein n=1 Tax=Lithohypha guttulata TaxID=1690604 RepID=UPI002DE1884D|nr:hypothetical protein LTR51_002798 [Lithohypha guttulata]KAK5098822.1 hypothetical protein LTS08_006200 [Lithohypha guttulata]
MKFLSVLSTSLLSALACAPLASAWSCLSDADVADIIARQKTFLSRQNVTAARAAVATLFSPNLLETSDSINVLRERPYGVPVYNAETPRYINDTLSEPPLQALNTVDLLHDCTKIAWYWEMIGVGGPGKPRARGVSIITVDNSQQIISHQIEFNSLQWAYNIGYNCTAPAYE